MSAEIPTYGTPPPEVDIDKGRRVYTSAPPTELPAAITFELDGETYTCRELGPLELSEIAKLQGAPATSPESMAFMATFFEMVLGTGQYHTFRRRCADFATPVDTMVQVVQGIFLDMVNRDGADRPTGPQSDSSDGLRTTGPGSAADPSSRVIARLVDQGRPDLASAVLAAQRED
jgi:hypothetical protein